LVIGHKKPRQIRRNRPLAQPQGGIGNDRKKTVWVIGEGFIEADFLDGKGGKRERKTKRGIT